jgi:hypothetical protein
VREIDMAKSRGPTFNFGANARRPAAKPKAAAKARKGGKGKNGNAWHRYTGATRTTMSHGAPF